MHELTSPQAFEGLRLAGRSVRRPELTVATMDHNVPTLPGPVEDPLARAQLDALQRNCKQFGVPLYATGSGREGIVHVIGPELDLTQPGMTIVCGDSHTSTHGAFGALAFGVGTSEVEHVLATRLLAGTRTLGAPGLRIRRRDRPVVRRHLPQNCIKIGVLPIVLPAAQVKRLQRFGGQELTIDLESQTIEDPSGELAPFPFDAFERHRLLNGLDDIGLTLEHEAEIAAFEGRRVPAPAKSEAATGV